MMLKGAAYTRAPRRTLEMAKRSEATQSYILSSSILCVEMKFRATAQPIVKPYFVKQTLVAEASSYFLNLITLFTFSIR
jgi:hypothetical protein